MRLSVVDCAHRWQVSFLPHPPSRGRVAAQRNCRLMSQLHLCSCSVVDVLSGQSSPHSHFIQTSRCCALRPLRQNEESTPAVLFGDHFNFSTPSVCPCFGRRVKKKKELSSLLFVV